MSAQPYELLCCAKAIASNLSDEASIRAVISRSYYAAFHGARLHHASLPSLGSVGSAKGSHDQLITCLDNPTIPKGEAYWTSKGVSKVLRLAFARRVTADYHLTTDISASEALTTLGQAEEILKRCGQVPAVQIQASQ